MIRTLLTTTALAALLATGAIAQEAAPATEAPATDAAAASSAGVLMPDFQLDDTDGLASRIIGFPVYSSAAADAEHIGDINDLVIDANGDIAAVIIGVGGFLGVGEKHVAVDYAQLQWTMGDDNTERAVLATTKEALNEAPAVDLNQNAEQTAAGQPLPADSTEQPATDTAAGEPLPADSTEQPATDTAAVPQDDAMAADQQQLETAETVDPAAEGEDPMQTGSVQQDQMAAPGATAFDRTTLTEFDESTLTAEELIGTSVFGPNDEKVGAIGDFVLGEDSSQIDAIIIDVGGFLGIGVKEVAIGFDNLNFASDEAGNRYLLLNVSKEQLESQVEFNRDTYANERDSQRLMVETSS